MVKKVHNKEGDVHTSKILDYKRRKTTSSSQESIKSRERNKKTAKQMVEDIDQQLAETLSEMDKEKESEATGSASKPVSTPEMRDDKSDSESEKDRDIDEDIEMGNEIGTGKAVTEIQKARNEEQTKEKDDRSSEQQASDELNARTNLFFNAKHIRKWCNFTSKIEQTYIMDKDLGAIMRVNCRDWPKMMHEPRMPSHMLEITYTFPYYCKYLESYPDSFKIFYRPLGGTLPWKPEILPDDAEYVLWRSMFGLFVLADSTSRWLSCEHAK